MPICDTEQQFQSIRRPQFVQTLLNNKSIIHRWSTLIAFVSLFFMFFLFNFNSNRASHMRSIALELIPKKLGSHQPAHAHAATATAAAAEQLPFRLGHIWITYTYISTMCVYLLSGGLIIELRLLFWQGVKQFARVAVDYVEAIICCFPPLPLPQPPRGQPWN